MRSVPSVPRTVILLTADLLIRTRTGGQKALDDGLREALRRGGDATRVWALQDYLDVIDEATGTRVMRDLMASTRRRSRAEACSPSVTAAPLQLTAAPSRERSAWPSSEGSACVPSEEEVLEAILRSLGVARSSAGSVALDDAAPLAEVRRAIVKLGERAVAAGGAQRAVSGASM